MQDTSTKPYLIRAIHEWCVDQGYTPYLAVTVNANTLVPMQFVKGGEIVLNVSPLATNRLALGNEAIEFQARFGGVAQDIHVPITQVSGIYARENGHGMAFDVPKPLAVEPSAEPRPVGFKPVQISASGEEDQAEPPETPDAGQTSGKKVEKSEQKDKKPRKSHLTRIK